MDYEGSWVWTISYVDEKEQFRVTVFNNEIFARLCYTCFLAKYKNVELNPAPVYEKFIWMGHDAAQGEPVHVIEKGVAKDKREYVKIYCCGDCIYYNWKKHKCNRGASEEGKPTDRFYRDCPLGLNEEEVKGE